jgi:hypothetical protein
MHKIIKFDSSRSIRVECALIIILSSQKGSDTIFCRSSIGLNPSRCGGECQSFCLEIVQIINKSSNLIDKLCDSLERNPVSSR